MVSISSASGFRVTSSAWLFAPIGFGISAIGRPVHISGLVKLINYFN
jgi:hypothetical protein